MKPIAPIHKVVFVGFVLIFVCGFLMTHAAAYTHDADLKAISAGSPSAKNVTLYGWTDPSNYTYWFEYGRNTGNEYPFRSPNLTGGGNVSVYIEGLPLITGRTYYGRLCNESECSALEISWTMGAAGMVPPTTYAKPYTTLMAGGRINITNIPWAATAPYTDLMGTQLVWGLIFALLFIGYWFVTENVEMPTILGLLTSGSILYAGTMSLGIPPEFVNIAQALMIVSVLGMVYTIFRRR